MVSLNLTPTEDVQQCGISTPSSLSLSLRAGRRGLGDGNAVRKEGGASCQSTATTAQQQPAARRRCGYCGFAQGTCHLSMSARRNICTYAYGIRIRTRLAPPPPLPAEGFPSSCIMHHAACNMQMYQVPGPGQKTWQKPPVRARKSPTAVRLRLGRIDS